MLSNLSAILSDVDNDLSFGGNLTDESRETEPQYQEFVSRVLNRTLCFLKLFRRLRIYRRLTLKNIL